MYWLISATVECFLFLSSLSRYLSVFSISLFFFACELDDNRIVSSEIAAVLADGSVCSDGLFLLFQETRRLAFHKLSLSSHTVDLIRDHSLMAFCRAVYVSQYLSDCVRWIICAQHSSVECTMLGSKVKKFAQECYLS